MHRLAGERVKHLLRVVGSSVHLRFYSSIPKSAGVKHPQSRALFILQAFLSPRKGWD